MKSALPADDALELADGRWRLLVAPAQGGSLLACDHDGLPVLRAAALPAPPGRPSTTCCYFPMIPFSNRIEKSRFRVGELTVWVTPNVAGSSHALHGHGWQAPWLVKAHSATHCELTFRRASTPDWPWHYEGRQSLTLSGDAIRITLAIENRGESAMPCGLGFHPFFARTGGSRLHFEAGRVWDGGAGAFPTAHVPVPASLDFRDGPRVSERQGADHCFEGWASRATVSEDQARRVLVVEGCEATDYLIVYIPAGADYFCVEPVTHAVNAMNLPDPVAGGWWMLEPGATRSIRMTIRCSTA